MKRTDIQFKDRCIVLGIFYTETFNYFRVIGEKYKSNVHTYTSFSKWSKDYHYDKIINIVNNACILADQIIFVLDDLYFPICPENSHTCAELDLICKNEHFFNKTIFVKGENVIDFDKNLVLN